MIDMNKNYEFFSRIQDMLYEEHCNLCQEFNIDRYKYPIIIASDKDIFRIIFNQRYKDKVESAQALVDIYTNDNNGPENGTIMYVEVFGVLDEDLSVVQAIFVPKSLLMEFVFYNYNSSKEFIIEYLKQSLRHEFGHMLSNIKIFKENGMEIGREIFMDDAEKQRDLWDGYTKEHNYEELDIDGIREYYTYYNNLPMETKANEMAGISVEDAVEFQIRLEMENDDEYE